MAIRHLLASYVGKEEEGDDEDVDDPCRGSWDNWPQLPTQPKVGIVTLKINADDPMSDEFFKNLTPINRSPMNFLK